MKKFIANSFCLTLLLVLFANFTLTAQAGEPIPGIDVKLKSSSGKEYMAKTSSDGKFTIDNLPKGSYSVSVRCADGTCAKIVSPRDAASGLATGKRNATADNSKVSMTYQKIEFDYVVKSPRDASSGLASGRRQHKPFVITKEWSASQSCTIEEEGASYTGHITLMK